ncbi:MAG: hypothetical protein ACI8QS_001484 [Planctomycetota bacterium]
MKIKGIAAVVSAVALMALLWRNAPISSSNLNANGSVQPKVLPSGAGTAGDPVLGSQGVVTSPMTGARRPATKSPNAAGLTDTSLSLPEDQGAPSARLELTLLNATGSVNRESATLEIRSLDGERARLVELDDVASDGSFAVEFEPGAFDLVVWQENRLAGPLALEISAGAEQSASLVLRDAMAVRGRITDESSGCVLPGARVRFWTFSEADIALTDEDGVFEHPRFPAGPDLHQVRIEAEGYGALVRYLSLEPDGRWALYSNLAGEADVSGRNGQPWLDFNLQRASAVTGILLDPSGQPVGGAHILAEGYVRTFEGVATPDSAATTSDAEGRFKLIGLRADIGHALSVQAAGFATAMREVPAGLGDSGSWTLQLGRNVAGTVFDPNGVPMDNVTVELFDPNREQARADSDADAALRLESARRRAQTDSLGNFFFGDAPDRTLVVRVLQSGRELQRSELFHGDATRIVLLLPTVQDPRPTNRSALALVEQP